MSPETQVDAISNWMPRIRPIRQEDFETLQKVCEADNHTVVFPTHVVEKDGKIVGYVSYLSVPLVLSWCHSKDVKVRDMLTIGNIVENLLLNANINRVGLLIQETSPVFPYYPKAGYTSFGQNHLFIKNL
jgi:hypothetical protein